MHGELIRTLAREGVRAIAFDVLFLEAGDPVQDEMFAEAGRDSADYLDASYLETPDLADFVAEP